MSELTKFEQLENKVRKATDLLDSAIQELQSDYEDQNIALVEGVLDMDDRIQELEDKADNVHSKSEMRRLAHVDPEKIIDENMQMREKIAALESRLINPAIQSKLRWIVENSDDNAVKQMASDALKQIQQGSGPLRQS